MRIKQAKVSSCISGFEERFLKKFGLRKYGSRNEPAIFFGCYSYRDYDPPAILAHRGLAVIIWAGSDSMNLHHPRLQQVLRRPNTKHIAISDFISRDLEKAGIKHFTIPICPSDLPKFHPAPLGDSIYVYSSHGMPEKYNWKTVEKVIQALPNEKFIVGHSTPPGHFSIEEMPSVYARCFIGLRLTEHDGLANTVVEMGLMGRRCLWNNPPMPNAVPWKAVSDVVATVQAEKKLIGQTQGELSKAVLRYVSPPADWLNTEWLSRYYE